MTVKRKIIVNILATIAFTALFLLPVIGFMTTETTASSTPGRADSYSGDYVFFIVDNGDVPLAAAPEVDISSYILWGALFSFIIVILFIYSAWYLTTRRNILELSSKMTPFERKAFSIASGYFHPIRCRRLAREAEATVASMYINHF